MARVRSGWSRSLKLKDKDLDGSGVWDGRSKIWMGQELRLRVLGARRSRILK